MAVPEFAGRQRAARNRAATACACLLMYPPFPSTTGDDKQA